MKQLGVTLMDSPVPRCGLALLTTEFQRFRRRLTDAGPPLT